MLTGEIIFKSFVGLLGSVGVFFFLGGLSFRVKKNAMFHNHFERIFWYLFIGLLQAVSLYAIIRSSLQTILLPVPILLLLFISKKPQQSERMREPISLKVLILFFSAAILVFLLYYLLAFISWDKAYIQFASGDNSYYARIADYLNTTGKENSVLEYLYIDRFNVTPYHYGDIWFCAFAGWLVQLKTEFALMMIVYPVLALTFTFGFAGFLLKKFTVEKSPYLVFICIFALFLSGYSSFYPTFLLKADLFPQSAAIYPKTLWISCFMIASFILVDTKDFAAMLILISVAGLTFINIFPSLIGAAALWGVIFGLLKEIKWKAVMPGGLVLVFALCYMFLFYKFLTVSNAAIVESKQGINSFISADNIKTGFNILVGGSLQFFILAPFLFLFIVSIFIINRQRRFFVKELLKPEILWGIMLAVAGLSCWAILFQFTSEAVQFFHNILIPLSAIFICTLAFWILNLTGFRPLKSIVVLIIISAAAKNIVFDFHVDRISKLEWQQIQQFLNNSQGSIFATYRHPSEYSSIFQKNTRFAQALPGLNYIYTPYINESLNTPFLRVDSTSQYKGVESSLIGLSSFKYYSTSINTPIKGQIVQERLIESFIKKEGIDYIIVTEKAGNPSFLHSIVVDSLILNIEKCRLYKVKSSNYWEASEVGLSEGIL